MDSLDKVFERITTSLAKNKLIGEKPTKIETPNFDLKLTKIPKDSKRNDSLGDFYKDKISFKDSSVRQILDFSSESTEIFVEVGLVKNG